MRRRQQEAQNRVQQLTVREDAGATLIAIIDDVLREVSEPCWRGSPFANAAAEFSAPDHFVRRAVREHRDWYSDHLTDLFAQLAVTSPGDAADDLIFAIDGVQVGANVGDAVAAMAAFRRATDLCLPH